VKNFFISYTGKDLAWAKWIASVLEAEGFTTVYQEHDFPAGSAFLDRMHRAMLECQHTIAVLSDAYLASEYCAKEWQEALDKRGKGDTTALIPVRVEPCSPQGLFRQIVYIDLVPAGSENEAKELLLARLSGTQPGGSAPWPGQKPAMPPSVTIAPYPGRIWNVPHHRNPYFTGRDDLLEQVAAALHAGENVALSQPQAITGLGGIGKTAAAVEFCYRHREEYEVVWWIRAESSDTLRAGYAALAESLNLPGYVDNNLAASVEATRAWLDSHGGWLMVFDNAETAEAVRPCIPQRRTGHTLITSRSRQWDRVAKAVGVNKLDGETAAKFLQERTESTDQDSARAIARDLDGLPLALEHAAGYVCANPGVSLADWLRLYRVERLRMLAPGMPGISPEHPESVVVTWSMAFERIKETPFAAEILNTIAFYAPDDIPLDLVRPCVTSGSELDLNAALAALAVHSLVERSGDEVSVHRLVQTVMQGQMSEAERTQAVERALEIAAGACPEGDIQIDIAIWPAYGRLLPHLKAVAENADAAGTCNETLSNVWHRIDMYSQYRLADLVTSRHACERALAIQEVLHGPDHPNVAIQLNNLGNVLWAQGDLAGARAAFERAIHIDEATYELEHPQVAIYVNNLGNVLRDLGDLVEARAAYERAIRIGEATYGPEHPNVAIRVNNLGSVLRAQGDLAGARAAFERAIRIGEATYGPEHPQVAIYVNNLSRVLQDLGDLAGARAAFERALTIDEAAYGPDHPDVAVDVNNLGSVLQDLGDLAGARAAYERALAIFMRFLGPDHPNTKTVEGNLRVLAEQGG
jgi:tetratricopeptide (TPR) repeat protein